MAEDNASTYNISDFIDEFNTFGVTLTDETANQCWALSKQYGADGEQMAVLWLTFSANHGYDSVTLEALEHFDREQSSLAKKPATTPNTISGDGCFSRPEYEDRDDDEEDLLAAYGGVGGGGVKKTAKQALTPKDKKASGKSRSISAQFHTATLSPHVATPSPKYASRSNVGSVVAQFGASDNTWTANSNFHPKVKLLDGYDDHPVLTKPYNYMAERPVIVGRSRKAMTLFLGEEMEDIMLNKDEDGMDHYSSLDSTNEGVMSLMGRIHVGHKNRLDADKILFEGILESNRGRIVPLDLSNVKGYSLFPGQIVGIKGTYPAGNKLRVHELVDGKVPPPPSSPVTITTDTGPVQLVVASGPFTTTSNMLFEPLSDFLTTMRNNPPHVLVLMGPFVDAGHPLIKNCVGESYDSIFKRCLHIIASALEDTVTQVVLVPSSRDVCSAIEYPTPPYNVRGNFICVSDPALLDIEGVVVALTATDILFHLGKKEISTPPQTTDRLGRLTHHILKQRCFYPLYPPLGKMCVASEKLYSYGYLPCKPHLFIIPSDLRYFAKEVEDCVMVNPEHLAKGLVGGTFARIELHPPSQDKGMAGSINVNVLKV